MDLVTSVRQYVAEMVRTAGPGMKVLLMDECTTSVVSCVYAQSEIMQKEVFLFERLDTKSTREPLKYLKCVAFLRATPDNVSLLAKELRSPKYAQYYIYFSNIVSKADVKVLAEADEHEVVREVNEYYCDYVALLPHLYTLNIKQPYAAALTLSPLVLLRCTSAIAGILLSLKRCAVIRYDHASPAARQLAEATRNMMNKEQQLFTDMQTARNRQNTLDEPPLLLIIDRRNDSVSPLLSQWTYQAMVHELMTINNNRVSLADVPNVPPDMKEVVLSPLHDSFYASNLYSNFGEIGVNCKALINEYQEKAKSNQKLESISDMKNFIENYPQFKKISGAVSKHVTIVGELSRLVAEYNLLEVSETEQILACHDEHASSLQQVLKLVNASNVAELDATRLVMLYALHYEKQTGNDIESLKVALRRRKVPDQYITAIDNLLKFGGSSARTSDLYGNMTSIAIAKKLIKGLRGVENIYTQHTPYLTSILEQISKGRLRADHYPFIGQNQQHTQQLTQQAATARVHDVIVFCIGGVTFEESYAVHQINCRPTPTLLAAHGLNVVLGGTTVHNAKSFIEMVVQASRQV